MMRARNSTDESTRSSMPKDINKLPLHVADQILRQAEELYLTAHGWEKAGPIEPHEAEQRWSKIYEGGPSRINVFQSHAINSQKKRARDYECKKFFQDNLAKRSNEELANKEAVQPVEDSVRSNLKDGNHE